MSLPLGMSSRKVRDQRPFFSEFLFIDFCVWLAACSGLIVTLAVFLPAEIGQKADLLKPAPVGIKPEWYFLFMFKTLKLVPEALGVALFALGGLFFLRPPVSGPQRLAGAKEPRLHGRVLSSCCSTRRCSRSWLARPGVAHAAETLAAETYSLARAAP